MFSVVITEKGGAQRRLDFDKNEVTIGRVQGNDIILPKGNVSKRHSRIVLKDNRFIVVDLKSTNGTYVNGRKITSPLVVKSGDKIYIGDFILTLEEAAGAGAGADMGGGAPMGGPPPLAPSPMAQAGAPPMAGPPMMGGGPMGGPPMGAPVMAAPPPLGGPALGGPPLGGPAMGGPPLGAPPLGAPPMGAPAMGGPAMGGPAMGGPAMGGPAMGGPAAPAADRRPPPLRSAPPPPRQPTLAAGGMGAPAQPSAPMGAPPPLPSRDLGGGLGAPRVPSEPPPPREVPAADRYPIDEEPADETMAPSPRVVAQPARPMTPASRPEYAAKEAPRQPEPRQPEPRQPEPRQPEPRHVEPSGSATDAPPRMAHAPVAAAPAPAPLPAMAVAPARRAPVPRARDARDPLGYVIATLADSIDVAGLTPPEALDAERWREARTAADAAIARLEREGGAAGDREGLAAAAVQEALGLGPLSALLDDPGVLEVVIEGPSSILVDRGAGLTPAPGRFSSADQLTTIVGRLLTRAGLAFDASSPLLDATLPDGAHLLAVLPPVAMRGPVLEIRRTGRAPITGESLVQQGLLSNDMLGALRAAVDAGRNVVVVGASEVGVSTVVSMIANLAPSDDRVLAIEETPELALAAKHVVRLGASARVGLGSLLATAPRLRADRVVIDGVSGVDTRAALLLLASRGSGCVLGVRSAPSAAALEHLEALASLGGAGDAVGVLIPSAVHLLVRVGRDAEGLRRILSIAEVASGEAGARVTNLFG